MLVALNEIAPRVPQDLLVERLTKDDEKLVEQIALYEAQTRAQAEDTQAAKVSLSEVNCIMGESDVGCSSGSLVSFRSLNISDKLVRI